MIKDRTMWLYVKNNIGNILITLVVMVVFPVLIPFVLVLGAYIVISGSNNADKHEKTKDDAA